MPKNAKGREIAEIIPNKCIGCQLCIGECPVSVVDMEGGVAVIEPEGCIGCGKCVDICPVDAIIFEKPRLITTRELLSLLRCMTVWGLRYHGNSLEKPGSLPKNSTPRSLDSYLEKTQSL
jgi:ferredoxin